VLNRLTPTVSWFDICSLVGAYLIKMEMSHILSFSYKCVTS
jgi:hypothetical protein